MSFLLTFSRALRATIGWPALHEKSTVPRDGDGLPGFLGCGGGVWESPCCEHVDQVCLVFFFIIVRASACCSVTSNLVMQVWPCRDAVCSVLGEQLLWHVALHSERVLCLYLPPVSLHPPLLIPGCFWLPLELQVTNEYNSSFSNDLLILKPEYWGIIFLRTYAKLLHRTSRQSDK